MGALRVVSQWAEDYQFAYLHTIPAILELEDYSSCEFSAQLPFKSQLTGARLWFDYCLGIIINSSFGSAVIPCRGGPCGRPQPTLSTIISTKSSLHWLRTATRAAPAKGWFTSETWVINLTDPRLSLSKQLLCRQTAYRIDTDDSINSASVSKLKPAIKASGEGSCVSK